MGLADLASLGSFASGLAVVVSLLYLAQQTRQNTRHTQALIQQGRAARIADTALRLSEIVTTEGMERCFEGSADVTNNDVRRFLFICRSMFVSAEDSFFQGRQGLLDGTNFESFESSLRSGLGSPGIAAAWAMTRDMYEPEFRGYMDQMSGDVKGTADSNSRSVDRWQQALAKPAAAPHAS